MKLFLNIATLATLLVSAFAQAKEKTPTLRRAHKGGTNVADNYFALISVNREDAECVSSAPLGNIVAIVRDDLFCIKFSYAGLNSGGPDLFSHIHGPAAAGETGPIIFFMDTSSEKTQCFEMTKNQIKDLDDELWYFDVHSEMCPDGAIRGQILPLVLRNVDHIVKQLRQRTEAVI
jgi:hypothetical protein